MLQVHIWTLSFINLCIYLFICKSDQCQSCRPKAAAREGRKKQSLDVAGREMQKSLKKMTRALQDGVNETNLLMKMLDKIPENLLRKKIRSQSHGIAEKEMPIVKMMLALRGGARKINLPEETVALDLPLKMLKKKVAKESLEPTRLLHRVWFQNISHKLFVLWEPVRGL